MMELSAALQTASTAAGHLDEDDHFSFFQIRPALVMIYPVFIALNILVIVIAVPANIIIIIKILTTHEIRHSRILHFMINAALCDLFKLVFVLPITLANLLLQNFVFGSFLCYTLPMLQVFPIHTSIINYAFMIHDRYQGIRYPDKQRSPVAIFTVIAWLLGIGSVLPYAGVIRYYDLGAIKGPEFINIGFCVTSVGKDIENYLRISFFLLFLIPSLVMVILLIKTASELGFQRKATSLCSCNADCIMWRERANHSAARRQNQMTSSKATDQTIIARRSLMPLDLKLANGDRGDKDSVDDTTSINDVECAFCTSELQRKEQHKIVVIATLFILSWTPATFFMFVTHFVHLEDQGVADILNLLMTLFGFLSTTWNIVLLSPMVRQRVRIHQTCNGRFADNGKHADGELREQYVPNIGLFSETDSGSRTIHHFHKGHHHSSARSYKNSDTTNS